MAGKDVKEVDNDYFLIPVKIMDHEGPLSADFPIENRLLPQGKPNASPIDGVCDTCVQLHLKNALHRAVATLVTKWALGTVADTIKQCLHGAHSPLSRLQHEAGIASILISFTPSLSSCNCWNNPFGWFCSKSL